jgi:hypothetical protein
MPLPRCLPSRCYLLSENQAQDLALLSRPSPHSDYSVTPIPSYQIQGLADRLVS